MLQNTKILRKIAWIVIVAVVFVVLCSVIFISQHEDHDCTGEDCPICAVMVQCANSIRNIGTVVVTVVAAFFLCLSVQKSIRFVITVYPDCSLISQKVRMNN